MLKKRIIHIAFACVLAAVMVAGTVVGAGADRTPNILEFNGSTTVTPIIDTAEEIFEGLTGYSINVDINPTGSGTGRQQILQTNPEGSSNADPNHRSHATHPQAEIDFSMSSSVMSNGDDNKTGTSKQNNVSNKMGWKSNRPEYQYWGWPIAKDAVCMIVYDRPGQTDPLDGVTNITTAQLKTIYEADGQSGRPSICSLKWSDLDPSWPATSVVPYMRETSSGTRETLYEKVPFSSTIEQATFTLLAGCGGPAARMPGNPEMATAVGSGTFTGALGYVGIGFINNPLYTNIRALQVNSVTPAEQTILMGTYPIARSLYLYTLQHSWYDPQTQYIGRFLRFMYSDNASRGQDIVEQEGFISVHWGPAGLGDMAWDVNSDGAVSIGDAVVIGLHIGEDTTLDPRFAADPGDQVDTRAGIPGYIRSDINRDGKVMVGDAVVLGLHW